MSRMWIARVAMLAQLLIGACATVPMEGGASSEGLMASVQATTGAEAVIFTLQVTNTTVAPLTLTFPDGQLYDFSVMRGEDEIWRWSNEKSFTQAVGEMTLPAGETVLYEVAWTPPTAAAGEYVVIGTLTADRSVRQATNFRIH